MKNNMIWLFKVNNMIKLMCFYIIAVLFWIEQSGHFFHTRPKQNDRMNFILNEWQSTAG